MRSASVLLVLLLAFAARAADRGDTAGLSAEPSADLADLFAWMSPDAQRLNLALTAFPAAGPGAVFSDAVQYVFHVDRRNTFSDTSAASTRIVCQFDVEQRVSCWVGNDAFVSGDASVIEGLANASGTVRVFTGARDDPFFFNASGFRTVLGSVSSFAAITPTDAAGCPGFSFGAVQSFVNQIVTAPGGDPPFDAFAGGRVLAIVMSIDSALVTGGGPLLSVWASTHSAPGGP